MDNRFNLIDEPWIPVADAGLVSLRQVFSNTELQALGGNPVQKLALMKLLLAIAQAAATPENDQQWQALTPTTLASQCLDYLAKWHDRFYLYGANPFLQMPTIEAAKTQPLLGQCWPMCPAAIPPYSARYSGRSHSQTRIKQWFC